jgi:hypothetical protein
MSTICNRLEAVRRRIGEAATRYGRRAESVELLAVSKTQPVEAVRAAYACGQRRFGESYLQEALSKVQSLADLDIQWHFIGRIQSNKTRPIAAHFDWVHSIDDPRQARRLSAQRPEGLPPLNLCIQVRFGDEPTKGGLAEDQVEAVLVELDSLPRLRVQGLMTLPPPEQDLEAQRRPFRRLRELRDRLATPERPLDILSMGMTDDLEAAIAEGASLVRVGTGIFGPRD